MILWCAFIPHIVLPFSGCPLFYAPYTLAFLGIIADRLQVKMLAEKHGTTAATILLKWAIQRGTSVVPKSFNSERIRENFDAVARPRLSDADMEALTNLKGPGSYVRFNDPRLYYGFDIYDESTDQPETSG